MLCWYLNQQKVNTGYCVSDLGYAPDMGFKRKPVLHLKIQNSLLWCGNERRMMTRFTRHQKSENFLANFHKLSHGHSACACTKQNFLKVFPIFLRPKDSKKSSSHLTINLNIISKKPKPKNN